MALELSGTTGASLVESGALPFLVGQVCFFAMDTAPDGFLKANGAEVSRSTYADLFSAIGTTFGDGDGSTTFELPDLRGEFPRGWDDGRGVDSGRSFGTAQLDQMQRLKAIAEFRNDVYNNAADIEPLFKQDNINVGNTSQVATTGSNGRARIEFDTSNFPDARTSSTTSGETRPRNIALLACIKY